MRSLRVGLTVGNIAKARRSYVADGLLLLGLCLFFFWRHLTPLQTDRWAFTPGDFAQQFYASAQYAASRLHHGQLPLWNPHVYAGHPFAADVQTAVFYPLRLLTMLITLPRGFSYHALELETIGHFVLVSWFTYLLARRLTRSRVGGLAAAVVFTFSGYLTSYPPLQLAILETQTWLPLILFCLELAAERLEKGAARAAARWTAGAGLLLGTALLAGHPQSGMLVVYAALAYGLFRFWPRPYAADWRRWRRPLGLLIACGLIGLGTAAIQILPSAEFARLSTRVSLSYDEAGTGFMPYELIQLVFPVVGGEFPALYVGVLTLGLATLALVWVRRDPSEASGSRRQIAFLGCSLLTALLVSFGRTLRLYDLLYLVAPAWRLFRAQERTIVWAVLAAALLAGFGAAWLGRRWSMVQSELRSPGNLIASEQSVGQDNAPEGALKRGYGLGMVAALALTAAFFVGYQAGNERLWGFTSASLLLTLFLALAMLALRSRRTILILGALVLDLFTLTWMQHAVPADRVDLTPFRSLAAVVMADREVFRIVNEDVLPGNAGLIYTVEDVKGASPMLLNDYDRWLERVPTERVWRLLNVRYVFSWRQFLDVPAERLGEEMNSKNKKPVYLYRLLQIGPRAWLAGQVIVEPDPDRALQRLAAPGFDPVGQVVLSAVPSGFGSVSHCGGEIVWQRRAPEHLVLMVTTEQPCILVLSELDYPGWRATVAGAPAPILRANGILRGLALTPGRHEVSLVFRPTSVYWGAAVSVATVFLAIAWLIVGSKARQRA